MHLILWIVLALNMVSGSEARAQANVYNQARSELAKQNYENAADLLRKHLRTARRDTSAWTLLGVTYYQMGLPRRAVEVLRRVEKHTALRSQNYLYQGLSFQLVGATDVAIRYFQYTATFNDEFGSRAAWELIVHYYNAEDLNLTRYWSTYYLQRFPTGPRKQNVQEVLKSLGGKKLTLDTGTKPDLELSLFKYHPLSLFKKPHFWMIQGSVLNQMTSNYHPVEKPRGGVEPGESSNYGVNANAAIGAGPIREGSLSAWGGYMYRQNWITDPPLVEYWLTNPTDIQGFPLRGDALERKHQLFGDLRKQFGSNLMIGLYGRLEFLRIGSSYFPSPDDDELKVSFTKSESTLVIPWIGASFYENMRTIAYLYLQKEINSQSPEHSNMSYDFTGRSGDRAFSFGVTHAMEFPSVDLDLAIDIFQYEYIFNDFWLDRTRKGALITGSIRLWYKLYANAVLGYYEDDYKLARYKIQKCDGAVEGEETSSEGAPLLCPRQDTGTLMLAGLYWNQSPHLRFSASYLMVENKAEALEYNESSQTIKLDVTWAFPSVRRVTRFVERYADLAFTKDNDQ
jgi:tetratricopeptide (TPR) repeat protein